MARVTFALGGTV